MAIDVTDPRHTERLSRSIPYWHNAAQVYRNERQESLAMYSGSRAFAAALGSTISQSSDRARVFGNLLQLDAQALQVLLAYGDPAYKCVANLPIADQVAPYLQEFLNRYAQLLNLGDLARGIALDSYFGYGIAWVANGRLPAGVRSVTGQEVGPMCWRVSQTDFGFDGDATCWQDVSYMYRLSYPALDEAQEYYATYGRNPDAARKLDEFNLESGNHGRMQPSSPKYHSAQAKTRLIHVYVPSAKNSPTGVIATWPANDLQFAQVAGQPLMIEEYTGHWSGPSDVISHLDIPDHLIPVAKCESTKRMHILYNELGNITSEQAKEAKYNPVYQVGAQRDIQRIKEAKDRAFVGVSDIQKIGSVGIPGPDQSQTSYMEGVRGLFNEFAGNPRDILGLGQSADTATGANLIRQSTTAVGADKQRRMWRLMENIGRKLAHLALNDPQLYVPIRSTVPGTRVSIDMSWQPPALLPRRPNADDYAIGFIPESVEYRSPATRLAQFNEATDQIFKAMQLAAQGVPIDIAEFVELQANYRNLPEVRKIFAGLLPAYQQQKQAAAGDAGSMGSKPNGQYTRTNVSERTAEGAITQAMTQFGSDAPAMGGVETAA